jgi:hypothetical protein
MAHQIRLKLSQRVIADFQLDFAQMSDKNLPAMRVFLVGLRGKYRRCEGNRGIQYRS